MEKKPIDYLEYGYVVEFENGEFAMYMPTKIGKGFGFGDKSKCLFLENYDNNLNYTNRIFAKYDIKKIYGYAENFFMATSLDVRERNVVWERREQVEMTVEEMKAKLSEILGVKIVEK